MDRLPASPRAAPALAAFALPFVLALALALTALVLTSGSAVAVEILPTEGELPEERYAYGLAALGGKAYLFGGSTAVSDYSRDIIVVRGDSSASVVGQLPTGLKEPAAAGLGTKAYVFGGAMAPPAGAALPAFSSAIYSFDPATGTSQQLLAVGLPDGVSSASAASLGQYIYVFGGLAITGEPPNTVFDWKDRIVRFDPQSGRVETLDVRLPTGRGQMAAVGTGTSILLIGGYGEADAAGTLCETSASATCQLAQVLEFTPNGLLGAVEVVGELPSRLRWAAAAYREGLAYVLGGCQNNCGAFYGFDSIVEIDAASGGVRQLPVTMSVKGGRNAAFALDGVAYVPGGVYQPPDDTPLSEIHAQILRIQLGATRPWAPVDVVAGPADGGGARLEWTEPAYDGGAPVAGYDIFRAAGAGEPVRLGEVQGTSFVDASARLGVTYTYTVRAANGAGTGPLSNHAVLTPTATPAAPVLAAYGGNNKVIVQWSAPGRTGGTPVTAYRLYAGAGSVECSADTLWGELTGTFAVVASLEPDATPVQNGNSYSFRVAARNANGWGACSEPASATASDVPDPPTDLRASPGVVRGLAVVNLTWRRSPSPDVGTYAVYRGTSLPSLAKIGETSGAAYADATNVPRGVPLLYAVAALAKGKEGPVSQASSASFASPPGPVEALGARWTGTEVTVWWEDPLELGGGALVGYDVAVTVGAIAPEDANATIERVAAPPFSDRAPTRGVPLGYHVRAVGAGGAGRWTMVSVRVPLTDDSLSPTAALSAAPSRANVGEVVAFDASGSSDDEGVVAYSFDFGDGQSSGWRSGPRIEHVYTVAGVFEATVKVRDLRGLESPRAASVVVGIGPGPPAPPEEAGGGGGGQRNGTPLPLFVPFVALGLSAVGRRRR